MDRRRLAHRALDIAIVGALTGAMLLELWWRDDDTRVTPLAVGVIVVLASLTLLRHARPGWSLVACMAGLYGVLTVVDVHNTAPFAPMLCGYSLALVADRRRTVVAGVALVPFVVAAIVIFDPSHGLHPAEQLKNLAFVFFPLVLGAAVRNRRDYLAALLDRAETAERTREEEAARRVGEERLRIAREVHDVVAHAMVAINVQAGVGAHLLDRDPGRARAALDDIRQVSGEALQDLRGTLGVLRSPDDGPDAAAPVRPAPGLGDLADLVAGLGSAGMEVDLDVDPRTLTVPVVIGTTGYRIVQEALTNVVRHAGNPRARVAVSCAADRVVIEVADDGPGDPRRPRPPAGSGNGVRGMRERATAVGGRLEAGPDGAGWRVHAELPVAAP